MVARLQRGLGRPLAPGGMPASRRLNAARRRGRPIRVMTENSNPEKRPADPELRYSLHAWLIDALALGMPRMRTTGSK